MKSKLHEMLESEAAESAGQSEMVVRLLEPSELDHVSGGSHIQHGGTYEQTGAPVYVQNGGSYTQGSGSYSQSGEDDYLQD
ncbi:hypothetical protein QO010_004019 [Caulobacter ginsengisoli]|uniref:Bacteriocin n=1 Tax=Caulobacter ginsengisoli TaxID=400775 RepID=A0ABU0IW36_9CAUL|nr:hypothetical protein [Caulobacter ginsengisoli]MDQ0466226.1 hypothetical protein [Caulobacter ginsengisoli]